MRSVRTLTALAVVAMLSLAGCADINVDDGNAAGSMTDDGPGEPTTSDDGADDDGTDDDGTDDAIGDAASIDTDLDTAPAGDEPDAPEDGDPTPDEDQAAADAGWQHRVEFDDPVVHEDQGVRLAVTGVGFTDLTAPEAAADMDDLAGFLDEDAATVLALRMEVSNDTGEVINLYANQGTIQLGREQVEADLFLSDSFAGSDWRDGVDDDGIVVWLLSTPFEDAVTAGTLDYVASAPSSAESWESIGAEIELTIPWDAR